VQAHTDFGVWPLGEPELKRQLAANTIDPGSNEIKRTVIDLGLTSERRLRALEFIPSDRRVMRAAFFTVQETGQWIGSWTPWYGFMSLPKGTAYRVPAGAHLVAEIHMAAARNASSRVERWACSSPIRRPLISSPTWSLTIERDSPRTPRWSR
jgi:hypothetical protein